MIEATIARYQTVKVTTSTPGDLLVALLDGLFKFLHIARHNLAKKGDRAKAGMAMSRAHAIISEFMASLAPEHAPELCENLSRLYEFCLTRITYANRHNDPAAIEEVMRVMTPIREAFTIAVRSVAQGTTVENTAPAAAARATP
ncbi:MAG TPA: flagellar export chaperone FliS [Polyangiaceae bacterium]|jgi:flagellar protein FliS|nr:flagellar export chaperone FliS [Polyangiaceae bacterium]